MKYPAEFPPPADADQRRSVSPVIAYPRHERIDSGRSAVAAARQNLSLLERLRIEPRTAATFEVPAGHFFRIVSTEGPQVGDLNLWHRHDLNEAFYSGKTRALHGTHLSTGDRLWSRFPFLRPLATISADTLDWYGWDADGCSVHDVIGTRCDPYTEHLLSGRHYHQCCHSNLTNALADYLGRAPAEAEPYVHDVLNVFMCTGFSLDTHQYCMKASPVRPGDYLEFFAEVDLLGALSACPGGDCSASHSSDAAACYPLMVEIYRPEPAALAGWTPPEPSGYRSEPR